MTGAVTPRRVRRLGDGKPGEQLGAALLQLLELIEQVHRQFENKEITLEELEERRTELLARLPIS